MLGKRELYCIVTEQKPDMSVEDMVSQACDGGAQVVQFRYKNIVTEDVVRQAKNLKNICKKKDVIFIINDYPELARDADADGVHIGQDDMPIDQVRHVIGPGKLIGLSTHSYAQAMKGRLQGADYLGFGPIFSTPTKPEYNALGMNDISVVNKKVDVPIFVIGGINTDNVESVIMAGAERVAVLRSVFAADDIACAAAAMRELIARAKKERIYRQI